MARPTPTAREAGTGARPPSVDRLARSLAGSGLPHAICVDIARQAIADGSPDAAADMASAFRRTLLGPVINATGVLLHTNLGRAPVAVTTAAHAQNVEFDLATGERGSRQRAVGHLLARLCGAEAAMVVNNNAAAVLLATAALAAGRQVLVSRGESVEIGGSFRVPEVIEQSNAQLVDVGTTNRTRLSDYRRALTRSKADVGIVLKVHPSNYRVEGFVEQTPVAQLAALGTTVVVDIGSGLIDASCPWLPGPPPAWLAGEPAARQCIEDGADLVTFSGDKLFGGPQAGIIVGRADLVERCAAHPLARALRPGGLVLGVLQSTALAYLNRTAVTDIAFWSMVARPIESLHMRAVAIAARHPGGTRRTDGRAAGCRFRSGSNHAELRGAVDRRSHDDPPLGDSPDRGATREGLTFLDLRSVDPSDDHHVVAALADLRP